MTTLTINYATDTHLADALFATVNPVASTTHAEKLVELFANERVLFSQSRRCSELFSESIWQGFCTLLEAQSAELDTLIRTLHVQLTSQRIELPSTSAAITQSATLHKTTFPSHPAIRVQAHAHYVAHSLLYFEIVALLREARLDRTLRALLAELMQMHERAKLRLQYHL